MDDRWDKYLKQIQMVNRFLEKPKLMSVTKTLKLTSYLESYTPVFKSYTPAIDTYKEQQALLGISKYQAALKPLITQNDLITKYLDKENQATKIIAIQPLVKMFEEQRKALEYLKGPSSVTNNISKWHSRISNILSSPWFDLYDEIPPYLYNSVNTLKDEFESNSTGQNDVPVEITVLNGETTNSKKLTWVEIINLFFTIMTSIYTLYSGNISTVQHNEKMYEMKNQTEILEKQVNVQLEQLKVDKERLELQQEELEYQYKHDKKKTEHLDRLEKKLDNFTKEIEMITSEYPAFPTDK